ncbi:hypothetical protein DL771_010262 [Monosporascus sp. 5C6A]|nr:hypothetical protein DL771_010262 [Monosporascus sp. 5C6A]
MCLIDPDNTVPDSKEKWGSSGRAGGPLWKAQPDSRGGSREIPPEAERAEHCKKDTAEKGGKHDSATIAEGPLSLPERRRITDILGDLDEDLLEEELPKEPTHPPAQTEAQTPSREVADQAEIQQDALELPRLPIVPKPSHASMIQDPVSHPAPVTPQDPPAPYTEVDSSLPLNARMTGRNSMSNPAASQRPTGKPPVAASQSRTVLSLKADVSILPSGEKATALTQPLCPLSVCRCAPVAASESRTVLSPEADPSVLPSGEKATALTESVCPFSVCRYAPVAASQSRTVLSYEADASVLPSREKATAITQPLCPSSVCRYAPVAASQSRILLSYEADASVLPSGEKATAMT